MKRIIIAVLLSLLGPGLGQFYNRDFKKGIILLILSSSLIFFPAIWLYLKVAPQLRELQAEEVTQQMVQSIMTEAVGSDKHILNLISFLFLGLWAYTITQAYFKAREINEKETKSDETGE